MTKKKAAISGKRPRSAQAGFLQIRDAARKKQASSPSSLQSGLKQRGVPLRHQLLITILPVVLIPLAIASAVGYQIIHQSSETQVKLQLQDQALLAGEAARDVLENGLKITKMVASNRLVINAARVGSQEAETAKLNQLPIAELEKRFAATKLLEPNQFLNDYLRTTAKTLGIAELFFTERNGFNIAYSNPTSDFVQRDEEWWQKGKSDDQ
ncbi:MAG: hypothetical protein AB4426_21380 [Xenococcaceae cyanobacterium]